MGDVDAFWTQKKSGCLDVLTFIEQRYGSSNLDKSLVHYSSLTMTCLKISITSNSISLQQALDMQDSSCPDLTLLAATFHHIFHLVWS